MVQRLVSRGITVTVDDVDPSITYSAGQWSRNSNSADELFSTVTKTVTFGATASYDFTGTAIWVYGQRIVGSQINASFLLDGENVSYIKDITENLEQHKVLFFNKANLTDSNHSLLITNFGQSLYLDFLQVTVDGALQSSSTRDPGSSAQTPTTSTSPGDAGGRGKLSSGTIAGIAVGGVVVVLLFALALWLWARRAWRRRPMSQKVLTPFAGVENDGTQNPSPGAGTYDIDPHRRRATPPSAIPSYGYTRTKRIIPDSSTSTAFLVPTVGSSSPGYGHGRDSPPLASGLRYEPRMSGTTAADAAGPSSHSRGVRPESTVLSWTGADVATDKAVLAVPGLGVAVLGAIIAAFASFYSCYWTPRKARKAKEKKLEMGHSAPLVPIMKNAYVDNPAYILASPAPSRAPTLPPKDKHIRTLSNPPLPLYHSRSPPSTHTSRQTHRNFAPVPPPTAHPRGYARPPTAGPSAVPSVEYTHPHPHAAPYFPAPLPAPLHRQPRPQFQAFAAAGPAQPRTSSFDEGRDRSLPDTRSAQWSSAASYGGMSPHSQLSAGTIPDLGLIPSSSQIRQQLTANPLPRPPEDRARTIVRAAPTSAAATASDRLVAAAGNGGQRYGHGRSASRDGAATRETGKAKERRRSSVDREREGERRERRKLRRESARTGSRDGSSTGHGHHDRV
ncbi:uncharacterized protein BXZ73DRAFT_100645 [Epithele typhae]|uniref:uncharacterized protein n=1 Tax=Epithele typhae TaxID=378194 RepID=UPI002008326B|nr:uncharacterized protein BXZ73DRAFT_100645 [Epithele typhae]KAH9934454.1 hypothetical protein BXZ73DRAFT_100645 [Epithele typhae]